MSAPHKKVYEEELVRLQAELVKMQYWVKAEGARDRGPLRGAGRRRQGRLDPPDHGVPEPAQLPGRRAADADRARDAPSGTSSATSRTCPPQARSSCSTAAGTTAPASRRVMGFCTPRAARPLPPPDPDLRAHARRGRDHPAQVLVLGERRGAGASLPGPHRRPDAPLEAQPDGPRVTPALGRVLARQGRDVRLHRHPRSAVVGRRGRQQARARASTASHTC